MNILGLAVATTEHHSACLLREGQTVLAVEEERLNRIKHFGQSVGGRSDSNLISDPTVNLDDLLHLNAVQAALKEGGLSLGDVDAIAVNGLPHRLWGGVEEPALDVVHEGRVHFVPHHLAHAASCYRVSGFQEACVAVVDGRGERNTATLYQATSEERLVEVAGVPILGTSVGGVYDTASRMIGSAHTVKEP